MPDFGQTVGVKPDTETECHPGISDNALFKILCDIIPDTVFIADAGGRVVYLNRAGRGVFGSVKGSYATFFVPGEQDPVLAISRGSDLEVKECTALSRNGKPFPALFHACPLFENGEFSGVGGLIEDVSGRKDMERALHKAEQKCRDIFQNTWEFWILCDFDGNILESNMTDSLTYGEEYNISETELVRMNIMDFLDEDLRHVMENNFRDVLTHGQSRGVERVIFKDGVEKIYEYNQVLVYEDEKPCAIRLLSREVTEEAKAKKALEISEARYRSVFENTGLPTIIVEENLVISRVNNRFEQLTGYRKEDVEEALDLAGLISTTDNREGVLRLFNRRDSSPVELECRIKSHGERVYDMIMQVGDIPETGQKVVSFTDITSRKKAENHLLQSREQLRKENRLLRFSMKDRYRFGNIIGKCRVMQDLYETMVNAAETRANVVLYGESGTGKELVAREIHHMSQRKKGRLVTVNCGAIPENIIESEFFGYKKGAFTGAFHDKPGYLDYADGGTLFLDEVGEINLNMQIKLLRAIDSGGYTPLGSNESKATDIRIISATNRNLMELVSQGLIREDFFYRIHIIPIDLPPLRERKEDIPLLIDHFMALYGSSGKGMQRLQIDQFLEYDWPGNVRELQNAVQRYLSMNKVDFNLLPKKGTGSKHGGEKRGTGLSDMMASCEKEIIRNALETWGWQRGKAADSLGINRKTLFKKIMKHKLVRA